MAALFISYFACLIFCLQHQTIRAVGTATTTRESFLRSMVNTKLVTLFDYNESQVYVYGSLDNEADNSATPQKWTFFYAPVISPATQKVEDPWVWSTKNEVRVRVMLGDSNVKELARSAIAKKYDSKTAEHANYWDIAPLMIDSLTAYVVQDGRAPLGSVEPFHAKHPRSLVMTFRFKCSTDDVARATVQMIKEGEYEIEVALYMAGFPEVSRPLGSITGDQLRALSSKTAADSGSIGAQYIHRSQSSTFISRYMSNVPNMLHLDVENGKSQFLSTGLTAKFVSLLQKGKIQISLAPWMTTILSSAMDALSVTRLDSKNYEQIWNSPDWHADRLTLELNKIVTFNRAATLNHSDGSIYFNVHQQQLKKSTSSVLGSALLGLFAVGREPSLSVKVDTLNEEYVTVTDTQIRQCLAQHGVHVEWSDGKLTPKALDVYTIAEFTEQVQINLITRQWMTDQNQSSIIRVARARHAVPPMRVPRQAITQFLTGEIKIYTGLGAPSFPWLLCDGSAVSRTEYQRLFAVLSTRYGFGDRLHTFNVPDFRGRMPLGVDVTEFRVPGANQLGLVGGTWSQTLTINQLPAHTHAHSSLYLQSNGNHNHPIYDPGHNHGGWTGKAVWGAGDLNYKGGPTAGRSAENSHEHMIPMGTTSVSMGPAGDHTHQLVGQLGSAGSGQAFGILPPYQTVNYIIYGG